MDLGNAPTPTEIAARLDALDERLVAVEHMIFGGGPASPQPSTVLDVLLATFITHLYAWLLGREPEAGAVASWAAHTQATHSLADLIAAIAQSQEFRSKHPTLVKEVGP